MIALLAGLLSGLAISVLAVALVQARRDVAAWRRIAGTWKRAAEYSAAEADEWKAARR